MQPEQTSMGCRAGSAFGLVALLAVAGRSGPAMAQGQLLPVSADPGFNPLLLTVLSLLVVSLIAVNRRLVRIRRRLAEEITARERLVAGLPVGVYELVDRPDRGREVSFVSERALQLMGISREQIDGGFRMAFVNVHPDDLDAVIAANDLAERERTPFQINFRVVVGGQTLSLRAESTPRMKADGIYWSGVITDLTQQQAAEDRFRALIENTPLSVMMNDAETLELLEANEAAWTSYGLDSFEALKAYNIFDHPPFSLADLMPYVDKARAGIKQRLPWRSRRADGSLFWEEVVIAPITVANRRCLFSMSLDITEQRAAQRLLAEREKLLASVSRLSATGGWELELDSGSVRWTEQTFAIHGLPVSDRIELSRAIDFYHPQDRQTLERALSKAAENGLPFDLTLRMRTADDRDIITRSMGEPVFKDGRVVKLVGAFQDITDLVEQQRRLSEFEHRFRTIFEQAPLPLLIHDAATGEILDGNASGCELHGAANVDELKRNQHRIWSEAPYDEVAALARIHEALARGRCQFDWRSRRLDGSEFWEQVTLTPLVLDDRDCVLSASIDITLRRETERILRESDERFRLLLSDVPEVAVQGYRLDGSVHYWNQASEKLYGYTEAEALGSNLLDLIIPPELREETARRLQEVAESGSIENGELELMRKDGSRVAVYSSHSIVRREGLPTELFCIDFDLSERKRHEQELARIANYDALTGLPNRNLLADLMRELCARADRGRTRFALAYLDLDEFKPINDQHGHEVGDQVLIAVANRLQSIVRGSDVVARLGGDEFVLLMDGLEGSAALESRLRALLDRIGEPITVGDHTVQVHASIGVTIYPDDASDPDILLRHGDQAMYRAKSQGRNTFSLFDLNFEQHLQRRRERLLEIEAAIAAEAFELWYQPKINLHSGAVVGLEGLIRWQHPDQGLLPPSAFLDDLAQSALEVGFGQYVIERALAQLDAWLATGLTLPISINVSGFHLLSPGFIDHLRASLARHPAVTPRLLQLEILESAAVTDLKRAIEVLNATRLLGVQVSLDDFGTGYSSLSHLRSLPVDEVKIDRAFVRDMLADLSDYNIVRSVLGLATAFNLRVVAEGVETMDHMRALIELGCDLGQGYAFATPMPAEQLEAWLSDWQRRAADIEWTAPTSNHLGTTLSIAINTHKNWLRRMHETILGHRSGLAEPQIDADRCILGRWLDDEGQQLYGHCTGFDVVVERHRRVHQLAAHLLNQRGTPPEHWLEPLSDLDAASREMIQSLKALQDEIAPTALH